MIPSSHKIAIKVPIVKVVATVAKTARLGGAGRPSRVTIFIFFEIEDEEA
jgi:hypothetical protein